MHPRILFCYHLPSTFIRDDLHILDPLADVKPFLYDSRKAKSLWGFLWQGIAQFFWLLRHLPKSDVVLGWFADYHLLLPVVMGKLFRKPVVIMLAGFDCIHLPELAYGVYHSRWRAPIARFILRRADLLLPVSESLMCTENGYSRWPEVKESKNGLCHNVPGLTTPAQTIPFGYDPSIWTAGPIERDRVVCTVALIDTERTFRRKGIDVVVAAASLLPDVQFRITGMSDEMIAWTRTRFAPGDNVTMQGKVPRGALVKEYHRASVYVQLSRAEGMPNVLSEAMMSGCIPVVSDVFGHPDTVGPDGFVVAHPEPALIAEAIKNALSLDQPLRLRYRQRMIDHFQPHHREAMLREAFERVGVSI